MLRRLLALASPLLSFGCATVGHVWVQQPEDGWSETAAAGSLPPLSAVERARAEASLATKSVAADDADLQPRPRLDHVVTLGQSFTTPATPVSPPASGGPLVVVNVMSHGAPAYGYGYYTGFGGYGSGRVDASPAPARVTTPAIGGDWPAPRSVGPNFPYHTAPAPAFERPR